MTQSSGLNPAELRLLTELGGVIATERSEDAVLEALFADTSQLIPFDRISIARYYLDKDRLASTWESGGHVDFQPEPTAVPELGSLAAHIFNSDAGFLETTADNALAERFPGFRPTIDAGYRSIIAVPLRSPDAIFGILHLQSFTGGTFDDRHLNIAEAIGLYLGSALTNIALRENLSRELQERAAMSAIAQITNSADEIDAVYERFANALGDLVTADRVVVSIIDADGTEVRDAYVAGVPIVGFDQNDIHPLEPSATAGVIRARRTMQLDQRSDEVEGSIDEFVEAAVAAGLTHPIVAPLFQNGEVFGSVQVRSALERPYSDQEIALIDEIVAQISGTTSNDLHRRDLETEANRHSILAEIARVAGEAHTFDDLGHGILPVVNRLLPVPSLGLRTISKENQTSTIQYAKSLPGHSLDLLGTTHPLEGSASGVAVRTRNSIRIGPDTEISELPAVSSAQRRGIMAGVHVSLVSNDEVVGTLVVASAESKIYSDLEVGLLEQIGQQIAGPMASLDLRERRDQESAERHALADIGRAAITSGTAHEMGDKTFEDLSELVGISRLAFVHAGSDRQRFRYVYANFDEGGIVGQEFSLGDPLTGQTIHSGEVLSFGDSNREQLLHDFPGFRGFIDWGLMRGVSLPLIANNLVIGTMIAGDDMAGDYSTSRIEFLSRVADQVAGAIDNIVLRDELARESDQARILAEISRTISRSIDHEVIGATIYGHLKELMGATTMIARTVSDDGHMVSIVYANVPIEQTTVSLESIAESFTGRTIATGELQTFGRSNRDEVLDRSPHLSKAIDEWALARAISVPVVAQNRVVGTIMFGDEMDDDYLEADVQFAQRIADQISGAFAVASQRQSEQRESEIQELLTRVTTAASRALDPSALFEQIEKELRAEFNFDRFESLLADGDGETPRFAYLKGVAVGELEQGDIVPVSVETLRNWGPILERSASDSPKHDRLIESGLNSWIQVPIGFPSAPQLALLELDR